VQVADAGRVALVDPVALADLAPLARVLGDDRIEKVVHAGGSDVAVLRAATGAVPAPLFDTQVAAGFAGLGPALSYGALVRDLFGTELPKHETRTDWLRRPLAPEQLRYAVEDVERLLDAARELERRLVALGRLEWAREDSARVALVEEVDPASAWRRIGGIGRLPRPLQAVARELAAWREREAERLDLARPFLLRDETLVALARRAELADADAGKLPGYEARRHARHLDAWREALAEAREAAARREPGADESRRPSREEIKAREALDERMAKAVTEIARGLELPPELLLSRRQRQRLIARRGEGEPLSTGLAGFRRELLGSALDAAAT
jgi:ribonuclease D